MTFRIALFAAWLATLQFDVVSVKPAPPPEAGMPVRPISVKGGPGTDSPTRFTARAYPLRSVVLQAFDIQSYQLVGPSMMEPFDIDAVMPEGTPKDQFREMLRNLLAERFAFQAHRETKEEQIYRLEAGKGRPKLTENTEPIQPDTPHMVVPQFLPPNGIRVRLRQCSMAFFANFLSNHLGRRVEDHTVLTGAYDFTLEFRLSTQAGSTEPEALPDVMGAVGQQLGLKLVPDKGPVEMLIVDHVETTPKAN
jgi:uncharacterized protein (TIGR03435 family)